MLVVGMGINAIPIEERRADGKPGARITTARARELRHVRRFRLLMIVVVALGRASPVISCCATLWLFHARGATPSAEVVFAALLDFLDAPYFYALYVYALYFYALYVYAPYVIL